MSEGHRRRHRLIETFLSNEKTADGDRSRRRRRRRNELLDRGIAAVAAETAAAGNVAPARSRRERARALGHACFWTDGQGLVGGCTKLPTK